MNLLVTGCAGFKSSHIVDALVGKHEVMIYNYFQPHVYRKAP
jgi:nucleoside-diphosphate-sugar epimerase